MVKRHPMCRRCTLAGATSNGARAGCFPTFVALERFEEFDELLRAELFVVFRGDLNDDLQVLPDVRLEHGFQALDAIVDRQASEVVHQPLNESLYR